MTTTQIANIGFAAKAGETIKFSTGTYTVLAVIEQSDSHNIGRLLLKVKGGRNVYQSFIRKNGLCAPVVKSLYKNLPEALENLKAHGATVKG
jgi:hypothetical protein